MILVLVIIHTIFIKAIFHNKDKMAPMPLGMMEVSMLMKSTTKLGAMVAI